LREQLITARVGELGNKTLGADFREVVAEGSKRVVLGGAAERFDDGGVDFSRSEGVAGPGVSCVPPFGMALRALRARFKMAAVNNVWTILRMSYRP
jgi:hypothetical protein